VTNGLCSSIQALTDGHVSTIVLCSEEPKQDSSFEDQQQNPNMRCQAFTISNACRKTRMLWPT
jgi:hypothetical protein